MLTNFIIFGLIALISFGMMFVPQNPYYGVRCKWSMYSDDVWQNVHIAAGYITSICLCSAIANTCTGDIGLDSFLIVLVITLVVSLGYSFFVYKAKIQSKSGRDSGLSVSGFAVDAILLCLAAVAVVLCLYFREEQAQMLSPFGDGKIATHFNGENKADGYMKASEFLSYFAQVQQNGIILCSAVAVIGALFTKNVFGGNWLAKISVAAFAAAASSLAGILYFTGIMAAVVAANSSDGNLYFDIFSMSAVVYFIGFAAVSCIVLPTILYFTAYVNCRKFFRDFMTRKLASI